MSFGRSLGGSSKPMMPPTSNSAFYRPQPQPLAKRPNNSNLPTQHSAIGPKSTTPSASGTSSNPSSTTSSRFQQSTEHGRTQHSQQSAQDDVPLQLAPTRNVSKTSSLQTHSSGASTLSLAINNGSQPQNLSQLSISTTPLSSSSLLSPTPTPFSIPSLSTQQSQSSHTLSPIQVHKHNGNNVIDPQSVEASSPFFPMEIHPVVQVVLRVRPYNRSEMDSMVSQNDGHLNGPNGGFPGSFSNGQTEIFQEVSRHNVITTPVSNSNLSSGINQAQSQRFNFDLVLSPAHNQADMFRNVALPMVNACLQGYNSTIFCYGQSGSGKSYTMDCSGRKPSGAGGTAVDLLEQEGIIPRSLRHIYSQLSQFEQLGGPTSNFQWQTYCSLLEVYNDKVYDLLDPSGKAISSQDVEKQGNLISIRSFGESQQLLIMGLKNRKVAPTLLNAQSSRSHLIFILYLSTTHVNADGTTIIHNSKMTMVDLAGSERVRKSGVLSESLGGNSEQLDEATHINKSLSCLSNVINKINFNNETRSSNFVPYRDSSLTRILRDSLGGNALTCVVACISPSKVQEQETLSTLRFAESVRKVKNRIALNEIKRSDGSEGMSGASRAEFDRLNQLTQTQHRQQQLALQQQFQLSQILSQLTQQRKQLQDVVRGLRELGSRGNESNLAELQLFIDNFNWTSHLTLSPDTQALLAATLPAFAPNSIEPIHNIPVPGDHGDVARDIRALLESIAEQNDDEAQGVDDDKYQPTPSAFALEFKLTQIQQEYSNLQEIHSVALAAKAQLVAQLNETNTELESVRLQNETQASTIGRLGDTIDQLHQNIDQLKQDNINTIQTLKTNHESKVSLLNDQHHAEVTLCKTRHQATIDELGETQNRLKLEQNHTLELLSALRDETNNRERVERELKEEQTKLQNQIVAFEAEQERCAEETHRADEAEAVISQHEIRIDKLTRKLHQVVTEREQTREKCAALEDKYTVYLQKCAQKIQNLKADHETTLKNLQELHQRYTDDLQHEHKTTSTEQSKLIARLQNDLDREVALTAQLQTQLYSEQSTKAEIQTVYTVLQEKFAKQSAQLLSVEKESVARNEQVSALKLDLATKSTEYETLFQINLSLSSHNNDHQKIKMQEILRDRLRVTEAKLRETQSAYDQLHQKQYVQSQRNRLQAPATIPSTVAVGTVQSQPQPQLQPQPQPQTQTQTQTQTQPQPQPQTQTQTQIPPQSQIPIQIPPATLVPLQSESSSDSLPLQPPAQQHIQLPSQPQSALPTLTSSLSQSNRASLQTNWYGSDEPQDARQSSLHLSEEAPSSMSRSSVASVASEVSVCTTAPPSVGLSSLPTPLQRPIISTTLPQRSLKHKHLQQQQQQQQLQQPLPQKK